jgi:hypothetical protein
MPTIPSVSPFRKREIGNVFIFHNFAHILSRRAAIPWAVLVGGQPCLNPASSLQLTLFVLTFLRFPSIFYGFV